MPEHNTRVFVEGLKPLARRFRELLQDRLLAEMDSKELLAEMRRLHKAAQGLHAEATKEAKAPQARARDARRRRRR